MAGHIGGRGPVILGVIWMETSIAAAFIAARIYTRKRLLKFLGWEDWFALVTLLFFLIFAIMTTVSVWYGLGRHIQTFTLSELPAYAQASKYELVAVTMCIIASATSKTSVACFLLRLVIKRWHKILLWLCTLTIWIDILVVVILLWLQCRPVERIWNRLVEGTCSINPRKLEIGGTSWYVVIDFVLALLPWDVVWNLHMKRKERLTVAIGLSLGVFAGICGIIRVVSVHRVHLSDYLASATAPLLWSATELLVTVLCSAIPVLRPLYLKIRKGRTHSDTSSGTPSYPLSKYAQRSDQSASHGEGGEVTLLQPEPAILSKEMVGFDDTDLTKESLVREKHSEVAAQAANHV